MIPWQDIAYLKTGTPKQQRAHAALCELNIFDDLRAFTPILVSTICLDIDVESSDLDIICHVPHAESFRSSVVRVYSSLDRFSIRSSRDDATVVGFWFKDFEFEIYGHRAPVTQQRAYVHLCQTARVIAFGGASWRTAIRALKERGMKTEPAVAYSLGLNGDPYEAVEQLQSLSDEGLKKLLAHRLTSLEKMMA